MSGRVGDEIEAYLAQVRAAEDAGSLAAIAAACSRELAPRQLRQLYARVGRLADTARAEAFLAKSPLRVLLARRALPAYENTRLTSHVRLFAAADTPRSHKRLLVLFAGVNGEAFMSAPRLLLRLPPGTFDVLRLRAAAGFDYAHGVPGLGDSFAAICRGIAAQAQGYAAAAALGGSLGAFPALRAAVLLQMRAGIAFSGRFSAPHWFKDPPSRPAFDPLCACIAAPHTLLRAYLPAGHEQDARSAAMLAVMRPSVRLVHTSMGSEHNVVAHMVADGSFDELMREIVQLGATPRDGEAVRWPAYRSPPAC